MPRRTHLRTRVLLVTGVFAAILFAITFGLSWRARLSQQRWSRLIGVETEAIATLEEVIRAQNAFRAGMRGSELAGGQYPAEVVERYRVVTQLLENSALQRIDTNALRGRLRAFAGVIAEPSPRREDVDATSVGVVTEAQRMIEERKREIARTLPVLERDTEGMMASGLAIAWIVALISFAVAQTTLRKVVRPLEDLASAAERIAAGDLTARAPMAGDDEVAQLGAAFNHMADELKARARTDDLTSLPNFRAFRERIDAEIERSSRYSSTFGVLILDVDHFKKFNDTHGHLAGNEALQNVAKAIRHTVRAVDFPARYGGEEFAVIVPEVDEAALRVIAERVRVAVEEGEVVTVSIGGALYPIDGTSAESLFRAADGRLYQAKNGGRNLVVVTLPPRPAHRSAD